MTRFIIQPNIGVPDLFDSLEDLSPFKGHTISFYVQEIYADVSTPQLGTNIYPNFVAHDVFKRLKDAGVLVNVEMGSVKPGDCQAQGAIHGMQLAVQRVADAGGEIFSFSVDEPLTANQADGGCHQSMEACADAHAAYTRAVRALGPIKVIYLEAWPEVPLHPVVNKPAVPNQERFLQLLDERDALPDGWRPDIDWNRSGDDNRTATFIRDARVIAAKYGIEFGVFVNSTKDPIPTDDQHHANLVALGQKLRSIVPDVEHVCVASWASRVSPDPTHATQNVPNNLGTHGLLATFNAVKEMFDTTVPPDPQPQPTPEGEDMFSKILDSTGALTVKEIKPSSQAGCSLLILADFSGIDQNGNVLQPNDPNYATVRKDKVYSEQPGGKAGWRDPGTDGQYERCVVEGKTATLFPDGHYYTRPFTMVKPL